MVSSCRDDTENQHELTNRNGRIAPIGNQKALPGITIKQMCRAMPGVFRLNVSPRLPAQSLEQWAASA